VGVAIPPHIERTDSHPPLWKSAHGATPELRLRNPLPGLEIRNLTVEDECYSRRPSFLPGIAFESLAGFLKKFRRHAQVHLRVPQMDMAQVNRQWMQESLHVGALLIPRRETVNREGMAVMPSSA